MSRTLLIAALTLAAGCSYAPPEAPSTDRLAPVVADLQMAEIYSTMTKRDSALNPGAHDVDSLAVFYREVFRHHHITEAQFREAMGWYSAHSDSLEALYAKAAERVEKLKIGHAPQKPR